jgi:mono/diheme cytochrome c family protein
MKFFWALIIASIALASCTGNAPGEGEPNEAANDTALQKGKQLFYARCASCHMVNKELTGPALKGVEDRWPDKQKLYDFIRNSQEVIKEDKYAHDLWLKYNQTIMVPHPDLTDEKIRAILDYVNRVSQTAAP